MKDKNKLKMNTKNVTVKVAAIKLKSKNNGKSNSK